MTGLPPAPESPADTIRRLAEIRIEEARRPRTAERARLGIVLCWAAFVAAHVFVLFGVALVGLPEDEASLPRLFGLFFAALPAIAAAGTAAIMTVRNWSVLSGLWVAFGFMPWAVMVIEGTVALAGPW